ncbi:RimK family alpha-L-glutamate ligase [Amycolatopsis sp. Hca4]|uniref:ATP-grasp domain-containing protein n=1 Tax=Amycolatopsis sp. Hca4 TaxID=2742131 RepID=UPI001591C7AC|nr:hypothetical protein [Amycolatopsis sp. Hca4]QKV80637.1 hypothetical protein HUT10_47820 [Amycolatopsis sp. Hca4]
MRQVTEACGELGLDVGWSPDRWIASVSDGIRSTRIIGYTFGLNDASAAEAALDKVCTFGLLHAAGIPAVEHTLIEIPKDRRSRGPNLSPDVQPPLVLKPNRGSGGADVLLCRNQEELLANFAALSAKYQTLAYSPFTPFDAEYRVVVLDRKARLVFEKLRFGGSEQPWKFNLNLGGTPRVVRPASAEYGPLARLAVRASDELGIRFGAVDIVVHRNTSTVLEVNDAFSLIFFSASSDENFRIAAALYADVLSSMFTSSPGSRDR